MIGDESGLRLVLSGRNNSWAILPADDGGPIVRKEETAASVPIEPKLKKLTPFLTYGGIAREADVLRSSIAPTAVLKRFDMSSPHASFMTFVEGTPLDQERWHAADFPTRLAFMRRLGQLVAGISNAAIPTGRHWRLGAHQPGSTSVAEDNLTVGLRSLAVVRASAVVPEAELIQVEHLLRSSAPLSRRLPSIVHGDLYFGNFIVGAHISDVRAVIDWTDTTELNDPWYDILLAARWFAFETDLADWDDPVALDLFWAACDEFGKTSKYGHIPRRHTRAIVLHFDLLWHLRVLVAEIVKERPEEISSHLKTLTALLEVMSR